MGQRTVDLTDWELNALLQSDKVVDGIAADLEDIPPVVLGQGSYARAYWPRKSYVVQNLVAKFVCVFGAMLRRQNHG